MPKTHLEGLRAKDTRSGETDLTTMKLDDLRTFRRSKFTQENTEKSMISDLAVKTWIYDTWLAEISADKQSPKVGVLLPDLIKHNDCD